MWSAIDESQIAINEARSPSPLGLRIRPQYSASVFGLSILWSVRQLVVEGSNDWPLKTVLRAVQQVHFRCAVSKKLRLIPHYEIQYGFVVVRIAIRFMAFNVFIEQ